MPENDVQYVYKILGKRVHHNTISKNLLYTAIHFYILYITQKLITCMHLHDIYIYIHTHTLIPTAEIGKDKNNDSLFTENEMQLEYVEVYF